jgi:hypothetical protein
VSRLPALALLLAACGTIEPVLPTCTDAIRNGTETDVDCGGSCGKCGLAKACAAAADCESGTCGAGTCVAAPTCDDHAKNGTETDVDCGGTCGKCADGLGCAADVDCGAGLACQTNKLCAPKQFSCGEALDCTQACPAGIGQGACQQECLGRLTPGGERLFLAFTSCIDGACPTRGGGVCDRAAAAYDAAACSACVNASLDDGGACQQSLYDCVLDG